MHAPTKPTPTFLPHPLFPNSGLPHTSEASAEHSKTQWASCPSPRSACGGRGRWSAEGGSEGSSLSSPNPQSLIPNPSLPSLIEDLLNPSITTAELCQLHQLTLDQLDDLLSSPQFDNAHKRFTRANATRRALLEDEAQTLATARLTDLLRDRPETPAHAETVRKAATTLRKSSTPTPESDVSADDPGARTRGNAAQCGEQPSRPSTTPSTSTTTSPASSPVCYRSAEVGSEGSSLSSPARAGEVPTKSAEGVFPNPQSLMESQTRLWRDAFFPSASTTPSPSNPPTSQPVPTPAGTTKDTHNEGVSDMNTKAAAAIFTVAMGTGIIGAAWYMSSTNTAPTPEPTPTPPPSQPKSAGFDLFSLPTSPSPAKVFFESAEGQSIPPRSRNQVQGMISMMAALIDRMHEFDADGDGMLSDLEKMAMGYRLRKEFIAEHDLDGDGDMSGDEWRAFQKAMFEQTAEGQQLMAQFDIDGDGILDEEEQAAFDAHMDQREQERRAQEQRRMDTNNDGEVSEEERRAARRQEREFWGNQMRTAESNFDYDGDGELNIDETNDAWNAWVEYQEVDTFITNYDTDGDRTMGPADYEAFLSDFDRKDDNADINNDGKINISDINAFRDLVIRSRNAS